MLHTICLLIVFWLLVSYPFTKRAVLSLGQNPCFNHPHSDECISLIARERVVSEATARTLIGRALSLYQNEDNASLQATYKPSSVAVACLASPGTLRPGPDSDCAACGPACTAESRPEVCELYCSTSMTPTLTAAATASPINSLFILGAIISLILMFLLVISLTFGIWAFIRFHKSRHSHPRTQDPSLPLTPQNPPIDERTPPDSPTQTSVQQENQSLLNSDRSPHPLPPLHENGLPRELRTSRDDHEEYEGCDLEENRSESTSCPEVTGQRSQVISAEHQSPIPERTAEQPQERTLLTHNEPAAESGDVRSGTQTQNLNLMPVGVPQNALETTLEKQNESGSVV